MRHHQFGEEPAVEEFEEWMPVTESGVRYRPRSRKQALEEMRDWPVGVTYGDGESGDGITHCLKRTVRIERSEWKRA